MSPDTLASLLAANPYPGCEVARFTNAVRLDFDGLILVYKADGWHFGDAHLESTLSEHSAPEAVTAEIRRILKVVMSLKVERALNEAEADGTTDPVEYLTNLAAEKMLAILDVAALANARKAKIDDLRTEIDNARAHVDEMQRLCGKANDRLDELERDLAAKDVTLKTAHAALTRICEVIGAPVPVCPADAVEAVKRQLGDYNDANNRAQKAEATIAEMVKALSDHGAPRRYEVYGAPDKLGPLLTPVERLRVTLSIHHWRASAAERRAHEAEESREALLEERRFARDALLDAGAPCRADGFDLDLAARIRAIPR